MTESLLTALITGALTLLGVIISNNRRQAVTDTKVEEQIKVINHRIGDLEDFHRPAP